MNKYIFSLFLMFLIFCGGPQGPVPGGAQQGPNIAFGTLTEGEIQRFLKVLPTFIEIVEKEGKDLQLDARPGDIMSAFQGMSVLDRQIAALDSRLKAAGMGWNEFWPAYAKTMMAYSALLLDSLKVEMQKGMAENQAQIKQMEELLKDPKIPEAQKNAIKASLEAYKQSTQTLNQMDTIYAKVPQANKDLVRRYFKTINDILNRD
uniref:Uncharacterized protein n=1 Tax=candidate division WOR-3 bacterium TaxID=2052148 RepID=A0A7C6AG87_UNCW3